MRQIGKVSATCVKGALAVFVMFAIAGASWAASTGTGSAYGLSVNATVFLLPPVNTGLLASTGPQTAPPDFNASQTVLNANVSAGILAVTTGVLNGTTQSLITQNSVQSAAQVDGLNVNALTLALGATTVRSTAAMSCNAGLPATAGSTTIVGGTGLLSGITAPLPNTQITVLDVFSVPIATVFLNEQIVSPTSITVNAIRIELNVVNAVTASVVIGQSQASIANCQPTVTIDVAPIINLANQVSYTVSGTCSAGSGNVVVTLPGATGSPQSVPCSAGGTWTATFDATPVAQGPVTITATQTDGGGLSDTDTRNTLKDTIAPVVTVDTAPVINIANQASYGGVTGTCSENGLPVTVTIGSVTVSPSPTCAGGTWSAAVTNVSSLPDGPVTVTGSQTDTAGNTGSGSLATIKDVVPPTVTVTTAPPINGVNQGSYGGVTGTCSENGLPVVVSIGGIPVSPAPVCSGGTWSATPVNAIPLPQGIVTITASQTDAAGNTGGGTRDTTKDINVPIVTVVTAPPINAANQNTYTGVTGACSENGLPVVVSIGSVSALPSPICTGSAWAAPAANVSSVPDGTVTITGSQTDLAGNTGSGTRTTSKDAALPVVTVTVAPPINVANQGSYGVAGACSENGLPVTVSVGSVNVSPSPTCAASAWSASGINVIALPEGVVTVTASQTDTAGNMGSGSLNTIKDLTLPVVTVTSAPIIAFANQAGYVVGGTCSENGLPVGVTIGSITVSPSPTCVAALWTAGATDVSSLPDGSVLVTGSQTDTAGNTGSGSRTTSKDASVPVVTVTTAPPINIANQASYTGVTGSCSENTLPVTVTIGGTPALPAPTCTGNAWTAPSFNATSLSEGTVVVSASQTDTAGNTGSGTRNTIKDITAPVVTVTTAPPINATNQAAYGGVTGTCSENGLPVTVTIGSVAATPSPTCTSSAWTAPAANVTVLAEGTVLVTASQTDLAGNTGNGTRNTIKDVTVPVVTVTTAPAINVANQASYTGVTGTCSENGLPVTVMIGSVSATPSPTCSANAWTAPAANVTSVPDGTVVVTASQTDAAGNTGSGTRNTSKDASAPVVTVTTAPPINATNQATYSGVTGTCSENGLPVSVSVGSVVVTPSPTCTTGAWTAAAVNATPLAQGTVTVNASQTDAAGNTGSGTRDTIKDITLPVVTVTTAPVINNANQATYIGVTGTCSENGLPVTVMIGGVGATPSPTCTTGAWTAPAANLTSLADGTVVVTASQTDAAGNVGSGTRSTTKDSTLPVVTVTTAPPINATNQASYTGVTGTCSENGLPVSVSVGSVNVPSSPTCTANAWTAGGADVTVVPQGTVVVTASQTDAAGNLGFGTRNTTKDTTLPTVTVATAPPINAANQASYSGVTGTCSENGLPVTVGVGSVAVSPSPTCTTGAWTAAAVNATPLAQGTVTVTASQTDAAGNIGSGTRDTIKDTGVPVVTVTTAPPINAANQANYSGVTGTCSENGLPVTITVGSVNATPSPMCAANAWTAPDVNVSGLANGTVIVTASQTDAAGNTGSGTRNTTKDSTAPAVTVTTAPPIHSGNQATYSGVTGTCSENGLPVTVSIGSVGVSPSPTCTTSAWTAAAANVTSVPDGTVVVTASQTDTAGNTGSGTRNTTKNSAVTLYSVSGMVMHDVDGLVDGGMDGPPLGMAGLHVYVADAAGVIAGVAAVPAGGMYTVPNIPNGTYRLVLSHNPSHASDPTSGLPDGWAHTGEGWNGVHDGVHDGVIHNVVIADAHATNMHFAVDARPMGQDAVIGSEANAGGVLQVKIPATAFTDGASDPDGYVMGYQIAAFPSGADSIRIGDITYLPGTFPVGGVFVPSSDISSVSVDPAGFNTLPATVIVPFQVVDNANVKSSATYSVIMQMGSGIAANGAIPVPTVSPVWVALALGLVALVAVRRQRRAVVAGR